MHCSCSVGTANTPSGRSVGQRDIAHLARRSGPAKSILELIPIMKDDIRI
jgi:hypothetical protein